MACTDSQIKYGNIVQWYEVEWNGKITCEMSASLSAYKISGSQI